MKKILEIQNQNQYTDSGKSVSGNRGLERSNVDTNMIEKCELVRTSSKKAIKKK